jgi:hypothetical protein
VLAGARIEPAGLVLERPARLELVKPGSGPALAFSFDQGGRDLHLVPSLRTGGFAALLSHFGGYALTRAAKPARTAARVPVPADPMHRIEHAIARVLVGGKRPARFGRNVATVSQSQEEQELRALMTVYYLNEVRPQLVQLVRTAIVDPDRALVVLRRFMVSLRTLELRGIENGLRDADAKDASELIQQVARLIFDARIRQCKRGEIRAAVIMNELIQRPSGLPIGIPPYAKTDDEVLGEDWKVRAAICREVGIRFELNTRNEYNDPFTPIGWGESATSTARLQGYASVPRPTAHVPDWRRTPFRWHWVGADLFETHSFTHDFNTACGAYWGWSPTATSVEVEVIPFIEELPNDTTEHLQVRFRGRGGFDLEKVAPTPPDQPDACRPHDFERHLDCLSHLRGDSGGPDDDERREQWYTVPLDGDVVTVAAGGAFPDPPPGICFIGGSGWLVDGVFQVTPVPPP